MDARNAGLSVSSTPSARRVDRIYVAATAHDARLARICIASIREYYADIPIYLLPGGPLGKEFVDELAKFWNVNVADIPAGEYGWGFVKLEPLFDPQVGTFLIVDSDTVMTGKVLDRIYNVAHGDGAGETEFVDDAYAKGRVETAASPVEFVVDDERLSEEEMRRLYFDWEKISANVCPASKPEFVFNSGQWIGCSGIVSRETFSTWVDWSLPRQLKHPDLFMPGDQGVLNLVFNQLASQNSIRVRRLPLMHWPGWGMADYTAKSIQEETSPIRIIHWAGVKAARISAMPGADVLLHFETKYYTKIPNGWFLRNVRATASVAKTRYQHFRTWLRLFWRKKIAKSV